MKAGVYFLPFEIIRALNSSIKVKICGEDVYFWRNSLT